MFTVALGIKVPVFPFHLWLPEVHSETDTCGSVLLAGVLLKVGSYGLMRFTLTLFPVGYRLIFQFQKAPSKLARNI